MKYLMILIIIGSAIGCQNVHTNGPKVSNHSDNDSTQNPGLSAPPVRLIAENTYAVMEVVMFDGRVVGVGTGIRNKRNTLFEFDKDRSSWHERDVKLSSPQPEDSDTNLWGIEALTVVNEKLLIALSNGRILQAKSVHGPWSQLGEVESEPSNLLFRDERVGYVIGRLFTGCQIFKTEDGGSQWKIVYENPISGNCFDLEILGESVVIAAVKDEYLLRSEDAGASWQRMEIEASGLVLKENIDWVKLNNNGATDLQTSPTGDVWVVGEKGSFYVSGDAGKTWKRPTVLPESYKKQKFNSIAFSDNGIGIAVGEHGYALVTRDYGKSWVEQPNSSFGVADASQATDKKLDLLWLARFLSGSCYILGKHGVYKISI